MLTLVDAIIRLQREIVHDRVRQMHEQIEERRRPAARSRLRLVVAWGEVRIILFESRSRQQSCRVPSARAALTTLSLTTSYAATSSGDCGTELVITFQPTAAPVSTHTELDEGRAEGRAH